MREFLSAISRGVRSKDIPRQLLSVLEILKSHHALQESNTIVTLHSAFVVGIIDIARDGSGFLMRLGGDGGRDILIQKGNLNRATKGDVVLARRVYSHKGNRACAKVIEILERSASFHVALLTEHHGRIEAVDIKSGSTISLKASQKSLRVLPKNTIVCIDSCDGRIDEVLGVLSDPRVDEKISLSLFGKHELHPRACEEQAESFGRDVDSSMYPERLDLRHLPFCTIDPLDAKDHDDAIFFDEHSSTLYVAIADVSEYVTLHSPLDKEARLRGFTIYLPHKSIPMLPRNLSENICSLLPGRDRLAFVWKIRLHRRTAIPLKSELCEALIRSRQKLSYDEVDEFLHDSSCESDIFPELRAPILALFKQAKKLKKSRLKRGYEFENEENRLLLDDGLNLISITTERETPAHSLIEECMLLANIESAKRLTHGIYRVHDSPKAERIDELFWELRLLGIEATSFETAKNRHRASKKKKGNTTQRIKTESADEELHAVICAAQKEARRKNIGSEVDRLIIRSLAQARYSSEKSGHFGLGFSEYSHFTSPIRRYADLMLHRLLKAELHNDKRIASFYIETLPALAQTLSLLERESTRVEIDYKDRKYARLAWLHLGDIVECVITDEQNPPLARAEGFLKGARIVLARDQVERLARVRVRLIDADIATAKIYGKVVEVIKGEK